MSDTVMERLSDGEGDPQVQQWPDEDTEPTAPSRAALAERLEAMADEFEAQHRAISEAAKTPCDPSPDIADLRAAAALLREPEPSDEEVAQELVHDAGRSFTFWYTSAQDVVRAVRAAEQRAKEAK